MLQGVCFFWSETGSEGGSWAFQDSRFIQKNVVRPYCKKCGKFFGDQEEGKLKVVRVLSLSQAMDGKEFPECAEGQHEREVGDSWSYDGSHILENGDKLTVFSPNGQRKKVWSGVISLKKYRLFTQSVSGFWIHADQKGIPREKWARFFFKKYPAELVQIRTK